MSLTRTPSTPLAAFINPSVEGSHSHLGRSITSFLSTFSSCVEGGDEVTLRVDPGSEQPHEKRCRFLCLAVTYLRCGTIVACSLEHALQHIDVGYLEIFVNNVGRHDRRPFVGAKALSPYAMAPASNAIDRMTVRLKLPLSKTYYGLQLAPGWLPFARLSRRLVGRPITRMVLVLSRVFIRLLNRLIFVQPLLVLIVWHVLPPRRGVRHRANTRDIGSFRDEADANSGVDDREGRSPVSWHFANKCRSRARVAMGVLADPSPETRERG